MTFSCHQLLHPAPWRPICDTAPFSLSLLREGPPAWTTDAQLLWALGEALYITLTEGRPFPEAPIQARAATASAQRGTILAERSSKKNRKERGKTCLTKEKRTSQRSQWVKKKIIIKGDYACFSGCRNFDGRCCKALHERFLCATDPFGYLSWAHQGWDFSSSFVRLTAGSRRGSAMTCYHSDRQAARWGVFLKVSCILFVEAIRARRAGSPRKKKKKKNLCKGWCCLQGATVLRCFRTWFVHISS